MIDDRPLPQGQVAGSVEPRSLGLVAYFDGYSQATCPGATPHEYPRRLTAHERAWWQDGYRDGQAERQQWDHRLDEVDQ